MQSRVRFSLSVSDTEEMDGLEPGDLPEAGSGVYVSVSVCVWCVIFWEQRKGFPL